MLKLPKETNDRKEFTEKYDTRDIKYLLSLSIDEWDANFPLTDGKKWGKVNYNTYRKYLTKMTKQKTTTHNYHYGQKGERTEGRLYCNDGGLQRLARPIREFVCRNHYIDVDISNCFPSILCQLYKENGFNPVCLDEYCKDRKATFKKYNFTKSDFNAFMNIDKPKTKNEFLLKIQKEKEYLLPQLLDKYPVYQPKPNAKNPLSARIWYIIDMYENRILQHIISDYKDIAFPLYDGFLLSKDEPFNIDDVNEKCKEFNIKWCVKPIKANNPPDDFKEVDVDADNNEAYELYKNKWEETRAVLKNPFCLIEFDDNGLVYMKAGDASNFYKNRTYKKLLDDGGAKKTEFFPEWWKDENRLEYDSINWRPYTDIDTTANNQYNSFKPFKRNLLERDYWTTSGKRLIEMTQQLMAELSGGLEDEEDAAIYFHNYISHIFQYPQIRPDVAVVMKGSQGVGKDTITQIINDIMGRGYYYKTGKMDDIFGNFNDIIDEKLILQFNEVDGKNAVENQELLKDFITAEKVPIRKKFYAIRSAENFIRLFIISNNETPVLLETKDRRYFVIKSTDAICQDKIFFDEIYKLLKNDENLDCLYSYFMSVPLDDFKIKTIPKTKAYNDLQVDNIKPIYRYLRECCNGRFKTGSYIHREKKKQYIITPTAFKDDYMKWLDDEGLNISYTSTKSIKTTFNSLNMIKERVQINIDDVRIKYTTFEYILLEKYLEKEFFQNRLDETESEDF